jgi:hypothetical protein
MLVRTEPFASLHIALFTGRFDTAARIFRSMAALFRTADCQELTPEFYCFPEFLVNSNGFDLGSVDGEKVNDVELPPWAKSPTDFVYMLRKALESPITSQNLHQWIDLVWGIKQRSPSNVFTEEMFDSVWSKPLQSSAIIETESVLRSLGQAPARLFPTAHPMRTGSKPDCLFSQALSFPADPTGNILVARIDEIDKWHFKVSLIDVKGLWTTYVADFTHRKKLSIPMKKPTGIPTLYNPNNLPMTASMSDTTVQTPEMEPAEGIHFTASRKEFRGFELSKVYFARMSKMRIAVVDVSTDKLFVVDLAKPAIEFAMSNAVGVKSGGQFIAVTKRSSVVEIYDGDLNRKIRSMTSFGGVIHCCAVSRPFLVVVIGTKEGSLIVGSLAKEETVCVLTLDGARPYLVEVTDCWGFIVTYAQRVASGKLEHFLFVFNINGQLLRKREIEFGITTWFSWTSVHGFDFMVAADDAGKLFSFEVFYCDIGSRIYRCGAHVVLLSYEKAIASAVAVTAQGRVIFVPIDTS